MKKLLKILTLLLYLAAVFCVGWFTFGYLHFSTYVLNPDAMLPVMEFERDALLLLIGSPAVLAACILLLLSWRPSNKAVRVGIFLPLAVCIAVVGHFLNFDRYPVEVSTRQFDVEIDIQTDDPIYTLSADLMLDGEAISTQSCTMEEGQPLADAVIFTVLPEDVPKDRELSEISLVFFLSDETGEQGKRYPVESSPVSTAEWDEEQYYTLVGNAADGYFFQN